jgi:DNA repair photolyase
MKKIISVSRRTDIPAFHGEWFSAKMNDGFADYKNPFSGKIHRVSLLKEDVSSFVFWSKNFIPFVPVLKELKEKGFNFYFNYTINNYPKIFEPNLPELELLISNLKFLSDSYSPDTINWRYDPIIISDLTDFQYHFNNFRSLAENLKGYVKRCFISFVCLYKKVTRNFEKLEKANNVKITEPENPLKIELANRLSEIALNNGIKVYSCCSDYLVQKSVNKGSCIDGSLVSDLFYQDKNPDFNIKIKPTRDGCGCYESTDIGEYDTCSHNCIYCYANKSNYL